MISEAKKREAEAAGRAEMKRFWGDVLADNVAGAIADIRVQVVEKGWYGQPLYNYARDISRTADFYGRSENQAEAAHGRQTEHGKDHEFER
jgi:hypothetical protein